LIVISSATSGNQGSRTAKANREKRTGHINAFLEIKLVLDTSIKYDRIQLFQVVTFGNVMFQV